MVIGSGTGYSYYCAGRYLNNDWNLRSYVFKLPSSGLVTLGFNGTWTTPATGMIVSSPVLALLGAPYTDVLRTNTSRLGITTPADLSDVALWLDGNDATSSGGNLVSWPARTGGLTFGPGSPVATTVVQVNGYPAVRTAPTGHLQLTSGTLSVSSPYTIISVFATLVDANGVSIIDDGYNNCRVKYQAANTYSLEVVGYQTSSNMTIADGYLASGVITRLASTTGASQAAINTVTGSVSGGPVTLNFGPGTTIGKSTTGTLILNELLIVRRDTVPTELVKYFQYKYNLTFT
jgi:hypothetical protein